MSDGISIKSKQYLDEHFVADGEVYDFPDANKEQRGLQVDEQQTRTAVEEFGRLDTSTQQEVLGAVDNRSKQIMVNALERDVGSATYAKGPLRTPTLRDADADVGGIQVDEAAVRSFSALLDMDPWKALRRLKSYGDDSKAALWEACCRHRADPENPPTMSATSLTIDIDYDGATGKPVIGGGGDLSDVTIIIGYLGLALQDEVWVTVSSEGVSLAPDNDLERPVDTPDGIFIKADGAVVPGQTADSSNPKVVEPGRRGHDDELVPVARTIIERLLNKELGRNLHRAEALQYALSLLPPAVE